MKRKLALVLALIMTASVPAQAGAVLGVKAAEAEEEMVTGSVQEEIPEEPAEIKEEEPAAEPAASEEPEPEYLIPDSSSRYLTDADLEGLSWRELCLARNEIFARHGRRFQTPEIASYFESKDWYEARYDEVTLSSIETTNVNFIINYEKEHYGGSYY